MESRNDRCQESGRDPLKGEASEGKAPILESSVTSLERRVAALEGTLERSVTLLERTVALEGTLERSVTSLERTVVALEGTLERSVTSLERTVVALKGTLERSVTSLERRVVPLEGTLERKAPSHNTSESSKSMPPKLNPRNCSQPLPETASQQSQYPQSKFTLFYYHLHPAQDLAFIIEFMKANFPKAQELKTFPFPCGQHKPKPYQLVIFIGVNARMETSRWEEMKEELLKFAKQCIFVRVHNVTSTSNSFDQPSPHNLDNFCWCKTSYRIELDNSGMGKDRPMLLNSRKLADEINALLGK